jgi:hypothetical protein
MPVPGGARLGLTTGQTAEPMKSVELPQESSKIQTRSGESSPQIAATDTLKLIEQSVATKGSGDDQKFHENHAVNPTLVLQPPVASLPEEQPPGTVTSGETIVAREDFAQNGGASAEPPVREIGSEDEKAINSRLVSRRAPSLGAEEQMAQTTQSVAETVTPDDLTFCRKWLGLGRIVCRREDGTAVVVGSAEVSTLSNEGLRAQLPASAVGEDAEPIGPSLVLRPVPSLGASLRGKRRPETVTQNAAEVFAREDLAFCRKWIGLGTIVCRKEDGTAVVVRPANVSNWRTKNR